MPQLLDQIIAPTTTDQAPTYLSFFCVDPRPDLVSTEIWTRLLRKAARGSEIKTWQHLQALSCLWHVRLVGTALRWDANRNYRFQPIYDFGNWESIEYYKECRTIHFAQYAAIWTEWFYLIDH